MFLITYVINLFVVDWCSLWINKMNVKSSQLNNYRGDYLAWDYFIGLFFFFVTKLYS